GSCKHTRVRRALGVLLLTSNSRHSERAETGVKTLPHRPPIPFNGGSMLAAALTKTELCSPGRNRDTFASPVQPTIADTGKNCGSSRKILDLWRAEKGSSTSDNAIRPNRRQKKPED